MSFLTSLLAGANTPFTVVLGITVLFALMQLTGVLGLLAGDGDHDADADADVDGDHDHDAEESHGPGILAGFGVGRVPMSILWQSFALAFALAGITANTLYLSSHPGALPAYTLLWTLPIALCVGALCTRTVAKVLGPMLSNPMQNATTRQELVGLAGVVISSRVNADFGEVRIKDKTGHVVRLICRTRAEDPVVREGREVVVVDYDAERDQLYVAPLDALDVRVDARAPDASDDTVARVGATVARDRGAR